MLFRNYYYRMFRILLVAITIVAQGCDSAGSPSDAVCAAASVGTYPAQETSPYVLPYPPGESYLVGQGNCTRGSHNAIINQQFAYDFRMPTGSTIVASRAGVVVAIEQSFADGTGIPGEENFVVIQHDDGTVSRYIHVTTEGVLVDLHDVVNQGDAIALSGNSGNSTEPHLHFDVVEGPCIPGDLQVCNSIPSVPINFSNTRAHVNGLTQGEKYTAE